MAPQCCRCNSSGRCRSCKCVRDGVSCSNCAPGRSTRCENRESCLPVLAPATQADPPFSDPVTTPARRSFPLATNSTPTVDPSDHDPSMDPSVCCQPASADSRSSLPDPPARLSPSTFLSPSIVDNQPSNQATVTPPSDQATGTPRTSTPPRSSAAVNRHPTHRETALHHQETEELSSKLTATRSPTC